MSWKPIERLSDILAAENEQRPVIITTYDDAGTPSETPVQAGRRYRIATEFINVVCTIIHIDYAARYPLHVTYVNDYGDHLQEVFSPDEILLVLTL